MTLNKLLKKYETLTETFGGNILIDQSIEYENIPMLLDIIKYLLANEGD